ncbi:hypothetical protein SCLCIDRAFT_1223140 [Scleroderma citrinum Foug A]|uniref:Uncharacterized protein n=1 Tax=Scleroderma citrinum Foug A TaxID=1036808 RepID=A0A0C3CX70_9AGAM|nr:hypothetical protein SCLCIDRAFT_1223140 [Scleroderma citrinum Foug A]
MTPQWWVITYRKNGVYSVEALDRFPWSDPLGRPGYERKLYLYSAWGPLRPQQMFEVDGPV